MEVRLAPAGIELHSSVNRYSLWYRTLRHLLVLQMLPINYDKTIYWDVVVMTIRVMIIIMHNLQAVPTPVLVLIPAGLMTGGISPGHLALLGTTQQMDSKYNPVPAQCVILTRSSIKSDKVPTLLVLVPSACWEDVAGEKGHSPSWISWRSWESREKSV